MKNHGARGVARHDHRRPTKNIISNSLGFFVLMTCWGRKKKYGPFETLEDAIEKRDEVLAKSKASKREELTEEDKEIINKIAEKSTIGEIGDAVMVKYDAVARYLRNNKINYKKVCNVKKVKKLKGSENIKYLLKLNENNPLCQKWGISR